MKKPVFVSAQDAAAMIKDGKTVATIGMTLVSASETILKAIEKRFLKTGSPNQLTLVHSCGQSDRDRGIQHFSHDGMLKCIIGGHWGLQPRMMKMIAENYDGKLPLYEHYWCIKVPHHGTQEHYFDFSQYEPENMMISNGIHFANSKKESKELRTSPLYGGLFYIPDTHMYCSNCDCCDCYENGCSCKEADVISPAYYKDI